MDEFLRLLTEFGADEAIVDLATRWDTRDQEGVEALTDEEITTLHDALVALGEDDEASLDILDGAVDVVSQLRTEQKARTEAAEQEETAIEQRRAQLRGEEASDEEPGSGDGEEDGDGEEAPAEDAPAEGDEPAEGDDGEGEGGDVAGDAEGAERQPVTASGNRRATARRTPRAPRSHAPAGRGRPDGNTITLADTISGVGRIGDLVDLPTVDEAMVARAQTFRGARRSSNEPAEFMTVATIHANYPEARQLRADDGPTNRRLVEEAFASDVPDSAGSWFQQQAIVAAGGICVMPTPIYTQETFGNARRPVRDALVGFQATRGGVVSIPAPTLPDLNGAVSLWTHENDATDPPDDPATKPCLRIDCGTPATTQIDAIPLCLTFGNFGARTFVENDRAWSALGLVAHARFAEQNVLTQIEALSTAISDETAVISVALDTLEVLNRAATGIRQRHRLDDSFPVRVILPNILGNIIQEDVARRMPGDGMSFDVTRTAIEGWLRARNINVTWSPDFPGTLLAAQAAGALNDWPTSVDVAMFPEGTFLFLDGGTLDLGVVRDSTLNSTNDFQTFLETFEAVHKIGPEALWFELNVCLRGAAMGLLDPADFCAGLT